MSDNAIAFAIAIPRPDWRSVASLAIDAVSSAHSKRAYEKALKDFLDWYSEEDRPPPGSPKKEICTLSCVFNGLPERSNFEM